MKTTVHNKEKRKLEYPCIGQFPNGDIVLFVSKAEGTILYLADRSDKMLTVGTYARNFRQNWVPFTGTIEMENEH